MAGVILSVLKQKMLPNLLKKALLSSVITWLEYQI